MYAEFAAIINFEGHLRITSILQTYVFLCALTVLGGADLDAVIDRTEREIIQTVIHKGTREHAGDDDGEPLQLVLSILANVLQDFVKVLDIFVIV